MNINLNKTLKLQIIFFIGLIGVLSYFLNAKAGAMPIPATNTFPNPAASSQRIYMSVGKGAFNSQLTGVAVTVSQPGTYTAVVREATHCNIDSVYGGLEAPDLPNDDFGWVNGGFETYFMMIRPPAGSLDFAGGTFIGSTGTSWVRDCTNRNRSFNFTVTADQLRPEVENRYLSFFAAAIGADNPAYPSFGSPNARTNAFDLVIVGGPGDAKVLPMSQYMNLSNRARDPIASRSSTIDIDFAIPCRGNTIDAIPRLFDLDTSGSIQPNPIYISIQRFRRDNNASAGFIYPQRQLTGANGVTISLGTLRFERDYWYKARLTGLYHLNAIGYSLGAPTSALAEIYAQDDCNTPSDPLACTITLSNSTLRPGETFTARLRFTNPNSTPFDGYEVAVNSRNIHFSGSKYTPRPNEVEVANNSYNNYIVSGRRAYLRTGQVFNIPANSVREVTISRFTEYGYNQNGADPVLRSNAQFVAPSSSGTYEFDWGLVKPGVGWASRACQTVVRVEDPPPPPSCNLVAEVVNGAYSLRWTSTNAISMSINQGVGNVSLNGNQNVSPNVGTTTTYTGTVTNSAGVTANCNDSITIANPVCVEVRFYRTGSQTNSIPAGALFGTRVEVRNPNPVAINVNSARYQVLSAPAGSSQTDNTYNNPGSIPANGNVTYSSNSTENITIAAPGTYTTRWTVSFNGGSIPCDGNITTTVEPITCTAASVTETLGVGFRISVVFNNPNLIPITITSSSWNLPSANPGSGVGWTYGTGTRLNASGGGAIVPESGGVMTIYSQDNIVYSASGTYTANWVTDTQYPGSDPTNIADCITNVTAQQQPYVRLYGNDVFAGGGVGNCTLTGSANVEGYGAFRGSNDHSTYVGAAVELAIFATGTIEQVLPGSQYAGRGTLDALGFANTNSAGGDINNMGGSFAQPLCADDFLNTVDTSGFTSTGPQNVNLNAGGANSEDYVRTGTSEIQNGSSIPNGKRVQVYVNGDVVIRNNIAYAQPNNGSWSTIRDIPLVRVYATGNIYIDRSVTELSGLYVAGGNIYTCTNGRTPFTSVNLNNITDTNNGCVSKLTVYGAFIAENVVFHRIQGSYGLTGTVPEEYTSTNIAESIVFSPELYLALLSEGVANSTAKFDSILSLPPAF